MGLYNITESQWTEGKFTCVVPNGVIVLCQPTPDCPSLDQIQWGLFVKNSNTNEDPSVETSNNMFEGEWLISRPSNTTAGPGLPLLYSLCVGRTVEIIAVDVLIES